MNILRNSTTGRGYDRFQIDAIHPPYPRRPRPLVIRWDWIMGAVLVLAVAAVMYGMTQITLLAGVR